MCIGQETFGFHDIQNCGTPSRENEDSFELQEFEIVQTPFSYEVAVETQEYGVEHNNAVSKQNEVPKANHHNGEFDSDHKPKRRTGRYRGTAEDPHYLRKHMTG